jgi:hypothetical protein
MQTFMRDLLRICEQSGLKVARETPQIIWHDPNQSFPGDTLQEAANAARQAFGKPPSIIFVCLPDTGQMPSHYVEASLAPFACDSAAYMSSEIPGAVVFFFCPG